MPHPTIVPYGSFKLYGLSKLGLHRGPEWHLIREFAPAKLQRIRSACERMTTDQAGYALFLLDESARTPGDPEFESWAWELIAEAEKMAVVTPLATHRARTRTRRTIIDSTSPNPSCPTLADATGAYCRGQSG